MTAPGLAPAWRVLVALTSTGAIIGELPFSTFSFSDALDWNQHGSGTVTVRLRGRDSAAVLDKQLINDLDRLGPLFSVAIVRNGRPLWAGPVFSVGSATGDATITMADLGKVFDGRLVAAAGFLTNPQATGANLTYTLSGPDLVAALLTLGTTGTGRTLPLAIPALSGVPGSSDTTYLGADLATVHDRITEICHADGGPDVYFTPTLDLNSATLGWAALIGNPWVGSQTATATFDSDALITDLSTDSDHSQKVTTGYLPGGTAAVAADAIRQLSIATTPVVAPALAFERVDRTTVSQQSQSQLDALVTSYVATYSGPVRTWSLTVRMNLSPFYGEDFVMGDLVTLCLVGHPLLADGNYTGRVTAITGATNDSITYAITNPQLVST